MQLSKIKTDKSDSKMIQAYGACSKFVDGQSKAQQESFAIITFTGLSNIQRS